LLCIDVDYVSRSFAVNALLARFTRCQWSLVIQQWLVHRSQRCPRQIWSWCPGKW